MFIVSRRLSTLCIGVLCAAGSSDRACGIACVVVVTDIVVVTDEGWTLLKELV